jgi:hypothetical protein
MENHGYMKFTTGRIPVSEGFLYVIEDVTQWFQIPASSLSQQREKATRLTTAELSFNSGQKARNVTSLNRHNCFCGPPAGGKAAQIWS